MFDLRNRSQNGRSLKFGNLYCVAMLSIYGIFILFNVVKAILQRRATGENTNENGVSLKESTLKHLSRILSCNPVSGHMHLETGEIMTNLQVFVR